MKKLSRILLIVAGSFILASALLGLPIVLVFLCIVLFEPLVDIIIALFTVGMSLLITPFIWFTNIVIFISVLISTLVSIGVGVVILLAGILNKKPLLIVALILASFNGGKWGMIALAGSILGLVAPEEPKPEVVAEEEPQEEVKEIEAK